MLHRHDHGHHHGHGHAHSHAHNHGHDHEHRAPGPRRPWRYGVALLVLLAAAGAACLAVNQTGQALVVSRFGDPMRVMVGPGLAFKLPPPLDTLQAVDLRLHTTSSGLQDVGTRDGLRIVVQAYAAWQVEADPEAVRRFLRAARGDPDEAARQLRSRMASALEVAASGFDLTDLVTADGTAPRLDALEAALADRLAAGLGQDGGRTGDPAGDQGLGIAIRQVGLERVTLPPDALQATVERMKAERETAAAERTQAAGRAAAQIRSDADRDGRLLVAQAREQAADTDAKARVEAARLYGEAYRAAPDLYRLVRSLDTLDKVIGANTRLVLRTDAAPFDVLVQGPGTGPGTGPGAGPGAAAREGPPSAPASAPAPMPGPAASAARP